MPSPPALARLALGPAGKQPPRCRAPATCCPGIEQPLLRRPPGRWLTTVWTGANLRQAKAAVQQPAGGSGGRPGSPPQLRRPLRWLAGTTTGS